MFFLRGDRVKVDLSHGDAKALVVLSLSTLSHCSPSVAAQLRIKLPIRELTDLQTIFFYVLLL